MKKNYLLFVATFEDGKQIFQNEQDKSEITDGKNCFYDVLEYQKGSSLVSFVLHNAQYSFGVDLRDGHFEVNGVPFFPYRNDREVLDNFRVIYYRNVQIESTVSPQGYKIKGTKVGYTVGWQANNSCGNNVQEIMRIQ